MRQSALARPQPPVAGFRRIPLLRFVPFLVATGANVHARRRGGITPLHEAAGENTHAGVVTALVEAGVDPNAQDRDGVAPLYLAAGHGSPAVVTALVAAGADLNVRGPSGKTPLGVAWPDDMNASTFKYRVPVVRELLRLGADGFGGKDLSQITNPTYCGHWHTATFHRVAVPADLARCLEEGADVLARDRHGNTVLHGIASMDAPVAAVLLVAGAEVNARNSRGTTPLHNAVESRNPATVSALLEAGADINAADSDGDTPLMRASGLSYSAREAATELAQFFLRARSVPVQGDIEEPGLYRVGCDGGAEGGVDEFIIVPFQACRDSLVRYVHGDRVKRVPPPWPAFRYGCDGMPVICAVGSKDRLDKQGFARDIVGYAANHLGHICGTGLHGHVFNNDHGHRQGRLPPRHQNCVPGLSGRHPSGDTVQLHHRGHGGVSHKPVHVDGILPAVLDMGRKADAAWPPAIPAGQMREGRFRW